MTQIELDSRHNSKRRLRVAIVLAAIGLLLAGTAWSADPASWVKKSFSVSGTWQIVEENGAQYFVLSDDFKTKSAPDLKIFLSKTSVKDASGKNATKESLLVGELPRVKGAVRLKIPAGTDLSEYQTVLLHCEKYSKLWAAAALR